MDIKRKSSVFAEEVVQIASRRGKIFLVRRHPDKKFVLPEEIILCYFKKHNPYTFQENMKTEQALL